MPFFFNFFKEILNNLNLANLISECIKKIFLNKLKIKNFRNHKSFEIELKEQRAIVLGCNGIGKSNLLESVEFLSQLKSNRAFSCLLYTSPSPRDLSTSRMPSSA